MGTFIWRGIYTTLNTGSCLETLVETIKIVIVDMVVDYKILVNIDVCDHSDRLVKVTVERAHEDAIVDRNVIILPNRDEEVPIDLSCILQSTRGRAK